MVWSAGLEPTSDRSLLVAEMKKSNLSFRLVLLAACLTVAACVHPKPPQPPVPPTPPPPPQIIHPELLLRQEGGVLTRGGKPFVMQGCIPCWDPLDQDHGGWSGIASTWVDYAGAKGCNAGHIRLGPFVTDAPGGAANALCYGMGPCTNDDCAQGFRQEWWDRALSMVRYAEDHGWNVEIDLIDGWQCRHALQGDVKSPWTYDDLAACGNTLTAKHKAFIRKAVETFCWDAGVIWEDGNEIGLAATDAGQQPYRPQWTYDLRDYVRSVEAELGCPVHLFGTNSGSDEAEASPKVDYTQTHNVGVTGPVAGKLRMCNEHNPPASPVGEQYYFCKARKGGAVHWYWRGAHSKADMDATLDLFNAGCDGVATEGCPFAVQRTMSLGCKRFGTHGGYALWDCTPKSAGGNPIWPEGDGELRSECEWKSMGGYPTFTLQPPLSVHHTAHAGLAFAVAGTGSSPVECHIPNEPAGWKGCVDNSGPLVVTVP